MMRDKLATVDGLDISDLDEKFAVFVEDNPDASTIVDSKDELQDFLEGGLVCQTRTFHSRKQAEDWLSNLQVDYIVKYEELEFPSALPVDDDKCVQLGKAIAGNYFVPGTSGHIYHAMDVQHAVELSRLFETWRFSASMKLTQVRVPKWCMDWSMSTRQSYRQQL
jgi:hypothetical protein